MLSQSVVSLSRCEKKTITTLHRDSINQSIHLYFRREPIETATQKTIKKSKSKKVKASVTLNANIQNVLQCRCHMHDEFDVENHFYIYQRDCQI